MRIGSDAFEHGGAIPLRFTCDGDDLSPPLAWSDAPGGTKSFVLLCDDPDAPGAKWHHWAAYDIAGDSTGLIEGAGRSRASFQQATNDFGRVGYGGPCPPRSHGPHRYHFRLLALAAERLPLRAAPSCAEVEREARKHVLAEATLVGIYERPR
jgi:Raf kinase inhibitor-like YbhB/YbcL family protein